MSLRVYNTLSRTKEPFEPLEEGRVRMYLCGPTVYKQSHIGHLVGPVIFDTIKRYLTYKGYDVTWVINITDVDDKLIKRADELGKSMGDLAEEMSQDYFDVLAEIGVDQVDTFPRATDHIGDMLAMIGKLVDDGHAYPLDGDVYFAVETDDDYGKLSNRDPHEMMAGTRAATNSEKRHPADFALWKGSKPGEPSWDSPWGPGRPGWHIECSAMSAALLGEQIDIHGGGLDLLFPHHENELAQSETCHHQPFAKYWLHNGLMQAPGASKVGGDHSREGDAPATQSEQEAGKLSGSQGAESVRTAVFAHHPAEMVRFFLLATHYRSMITFSLDNIGEMRKSAEGFYRLFESYERVTGESFYDLDAAIRERDGLDLSDASDEMLRDLAHYRDRFREAMDDDFNTGGAIGQLFEMRRTLNAYISAGKLEVEADDAQRQTLRAGMTVLRELTQTLGLFVRPSEQAAADDNFASDLMDLVLELREDMRSTKNWDAADKIRDRLTALGVTVEDGAGGVRWSRS